MPQIGRSERALSSDDDGSSEHAPSSDEEGSESKQLRVSFVHHERRANRALDPTSPRDHEASRRTISFVEVAGQLAMSSAGLDDIIEFVDDQIAHDLQLQSHERANYQLFTVQTGAIGDARVYLRSESVWRQVRQSWISAGAFDATIFVETAAPFSAGLLSTIDLVALQRGVSRRRTGPAGLEAPRTLRAALAAADAHATVIVWQQLHAAEVIDWCRFQLNVVRRIFGTSSCHPNPAMWFCWCGCKSDGDRGSYATEVIHARTVGDLSSFGKHLSTCRWEGAAVMRKRLFEFELYNEISTPLPNRTPTISVPPRLIFDTEPRLSDGEGLLSPARCLDLACHLGASPLL